MNNEKFPMLHKKPMRGLKNENSGQMIVLMGFFLVVAIVVLATMQADLANMGSEVYRRHSRALLPELLDVKEKFNLAFMYNSNEYGIEEGFQKTNEFFYLTEMRHGTYFNAMLNDCQYSGLVQYSNTYYNAIYHASVTLTLSDGSTTISRDVVYMLLITTSEGV